MCDVAERLEKMGIVKGIEIGRLEGKEEGKAEGKAEGILEGKMQVYRNLLKRDLRKKKQGKLQKFRDMSVVLFLYIAAKGYNI